MSFASSGSRPRRILFGVGLALLAVSLVMIAVRWQTSDRRLLNDWSSTHFDPNLSFTDNQRLRREGLRSVAPRILPLLRRDLNFESATREKLNHAAWRVATRFDLQLGIVAEPPQFVRERAARLLAELGPEAKPALPDLIRRTRDPEALVRSSSALALGNIGDRSTEVIAALTPLVSERNRDVSVSAAYALWRLQPEDSIAIERFASMIGPKHGPDNLGRVSIWLMDCGETALPLAPALRQAIKEDLSTDARVRAVQALWRITGETEPALALSELFITEIKAGGVGANPAIGLIKAQNGLSSAVFLLSDMPELRAKLKPDLVQWSADTADPRRSRWAKQLLDRLEKSETGATASP